MAFCRTRSGTLRLVFEGQEFWLDANGRELPEELAESIRPHVNVVVDEKKPAPPELKPSRRSSRDADD